MKIRPEHYEVIRLAIQRITPDMRAHMAATATADPRVKDLAKRIRWDLLWFTGLTKWLCDTVYPYADDSHVDAALRAIVKELEL